MSDCRFGVSPVTILILILIAVIYKNSVEGKIKAIPAESDYILWLRLDHTLFNIQEDVILHVLYIPPTQSRFLSEDEYSCLETEITSVCAVCHHMFA